MLQLSKIKTKLALGVAVALVTGTVGLMSLGAVHAVSPGSMPTSKEVCKHDGWKAYTNPDGSKMFKNQGECVSSVASQGHGGGSGYGGSNGNTVNTSVNITLNNSNNNVINVIIRLVFGG